MVAGTPKRAVPRVRKLYQLQLNDDDKVWGSQLSAFTKK